MINIYIENGNDKTNDFIQLIKKSNLKDAFVFINKNSIKNFKLTDSLKSYNILYVDNDSFDDLKEEDIFDFLIEVININAKVYFKNFDSFLKNSELVNISKDLEVFSKFINSNFEIDLTNPNINLYTTVLEIFNEKTFNININLDIIENISFNINNNNIYNEHNELIGTLFDSEIIPQLLSKVKILNLTDDKDLAFSSFVPQTDIFYFTNDNKLKYIQKYKKDVFDKIKNLSKNDFLNLNIGFQELLINNEYVDLNTIIQILNN